MDFNRFQFNQFFTTVAILSVTPIVYAQEQTAAVPADKVDPAMQVLPQVLIQSDAGAYDPRRDDTAAKIVVNADELTKYGDANVADALKRIPGVTVTSTGRGVDIRLRGLGRGYTQILVNGLPAPIGFSIDSLNPGQVERLEVIRSATAEFSTESVAGTINIVLKNIPKTAQRQFQLGYGGDSTERTPRAMFLLSDKHGGFSYSLSANTRITWYDRNSLITDTNTSLLNKINLDQKTTSRENARLTSFNLIPRLNWVLPNKGTITWETIASYVKFNFDADRRTDVPSEVYQDFPGLDWRIKTRKASGSSNVTWSSRLSPETKLEIKLGVQGSSSDNDSSRILFNQFLHQPLDNQNFHSVDKGYNNSGKLMKKMTDAHQLTSGWEASINHRKITGIEDVANSLGPATTQSFENSKATVLRAAAFVQDEWTVSSNWSIYLGARFDHIGTEVEADRNSSVSANIWSPIVQTLIKLPNMPNDQIRLAVTRTFKAPDLTSLSPQRRRFEINSATNPDVEGNPSLRPELARGIDVTYEHYFNKTALLSIGASSRDIDDYTQTIIDLGDDGRWVGRPVNSGKARTRGLELEAKFPLTLIQPQWPAVQLRGSVSRNWSSVNNVPGPDNRIAQQIPLQVSLSADYAFGEITTGGSFVFRQGVWSTVTAAQRTLTVNRRDLDLYALWKMDGKNQLRITLGNLLRAGELTANQFRTTQEILTRTTDTPGSASVRVLFERKF